MLNFVFYSAIIIASIAFWIACIDKIFNLEICEVMIILMSRIDDKLHRPKIKIKRICDNAKYEVGKTYITIYSRTKETIYDESEIKTGLLINQRQVSKDSKPEIELYHKFGIIDYDLRNAHDGVKEAKLFLKHRDDFNPININIGDKLLTLHYPKNKKIKVIEKKGRGN